MTIDIHCHLWWPECLNERYWDWTAKLLSEETRFGDERTVEWVNENIMPKLWDPDGEFLIRRMDKAGIEKTCLLPLDMGLLEGIGEAPLTIEQQNKHVSEVAKRYPDRIIYFCGLDPRRPNALELFEKFVTEFGARGIKLYPTCGFYLDDKVLYPILEKASAWKLPVLPHVGPEPPPFEGKYSHPSHLERTLQDFPDLKVIAAHMGLDWWRDLIAVGKKYKNLMADFAGHQANAIENYGRFCYMLRRFLDELGPDRVLFGTDGPLIDVDLASDKWVKLIQDLPQKSPQNIQFTEEEVSNILDRNARRVLGL